jgi:hypothetical protein
MCRDIPFLDGMILSAIDDVICHIFIAIDDVIFPLPLIMPYFSSIILLLMLLNS